ncbi:LLM class flavin-dependent oxidoreductase [Streptomyces sp. 4N124]|uniref:LLM class flavin-dependent oxidoreductase n=1 Tax=Streptomyces sp. 4N124 TaxID=3457420 RepID=UPI003FD312C7
MRFDIFHLPTFDPRVDGTDSAMFARLRDVTVAADRLGYHGAWFAEHHFQAHGGLLSAPDVVIAGLADAAPRLRFGLGVVQVPYHHPLSVAERIATLDQVTGGRLDVGLGRAFLKSEYDGFGVPMDESRERFVEGVDVIARALRGPLEEHHGRTATFPALTVHPRCRQEPSPPLWVAASTTPQTFEWAGNGGFNLMVAPLLSADASKLTEKIDLYRKAREEASLPPGEILVNVHVHVSDTGPQARAEADGALLRYVAETRAAGSSAIASFMRDGVPADFAHYPELGKRWGTFTVDGAIERSAVLIGDPEGVADSLAALIADTRATVVAGTFDFGQDRVAVTRSLELFAEHVAPHFGSRAAAA